MEPILILGATSDIAREIAEIYAAHGYPLYLAARDVNTLQGEVRRLADTDGIAVEAFPFDVLDMASHQSFYDTLTPKPLGVICCIGYLGDQTLAVQDFQEARTILDTNYTGCVSILNVVARDMEERKTGFIIGISSVAGDRGRQSNYIYGSAKAAFSAYLSGLRNRLFPHNVHVLTVKPGFVATRMTAHLSLSPALTAQPKDLAKAIFQAQQARQDVLYYKPLWWIIMTIIRLVPEWLFKRLKL